MGNSAPTGAAPARPPAPRNPGQSVPNGPLVAPKAETVANGSVQAANGVGKPASEADPNNNNNQQQLARLTVFKDAVKSAKNMKKADVTAETLPFDQLKEVLRQLQTVDSVNNPNLVYALSFLSYFTSAGSFGEKIATRWCQELGDSGYAAFLARLWPSFFEPENILCLSDSSADKNNRELAFRSLFRIVLNGTDLSSDFCRHTADAGLVEKALQMLSRPELQYEQLKDAEEASLSRSAFRVLTGILYNCFRHQFAETRQRFRAAHGTETCLAFFKSSSFNLFNAKALFVLILGLNDDEYCKLTEQAIDFLAKSLLLPACNDDHCRIVSSTDSIHARDIADVLNCLANSEPMAEQLIEHGVLECYLKMQQKLKSTNDLLVVANGFWTFSFCKSKQEQMRKSAELVEALEHLSTHKKPTIGRAASGAIWNLCGKGRAASNGKTVAFKDGVVVDGEETKGVRQILISFCSANLDSARVLREQLVAAGYRTTAVSDKRELARVDKMASGVEKSALVIVCASEDYKSSLSCRQELEYAVKLQRSILPVSLESEHAPTSGWLQAILGQTKMFQCAQLLPSAFESILAEISSRGIVFPVANLDSFKLDEKALARSSVAAWTKQQVADWLRRSSLAEIVSNFSEIDGLLLLELQQMLLRAPTVFYRRAEKDLGVKALVQLLMLTKALQSLSS